jgi:hypothetical protein
MLVYCKKCKKKTKRVKPDKRCKNDVGRCKNCCNKNHKLYYNKHKKFFKKYNKQYYLNNKKELIKNSIQYKHNHKKRIHHLNKSYNLKARVGITLEQKINMIKKQNYKCKICYTDLRKINEKGVHVDHNHKTKKVRGILCYRCNHILGFSKDNINILNSAIKYLKEAN